MVPDKAVVHHQLARVYEKLGKYDQAVAQYQEAIRDMPFLIPVRLDLARLYAERREFDLAQGQYKAILEEDPTLAEVHFNMALIYELSGNLKDAAIHYENFLGSVPQDPVYASHRQAAEKWLASLKVKQK
jgi:tetratricopeptide (TPR) repeat protein